MGWAKMLKRVFSIDIQTCLKCGGQIKVISAIHNQQVIKRILTHIGENAKVSELSPPRGPPSNRRESCQYLSFISHFHHLLKQSIMWLCQGIALPEKSVKAQDFSLKTGLVVMVLKSFYLTLLPFFRYFC